MKYSSSQKIVRGLGIFALMVGIFIVGAYVGTRTSVAKLLTPAETVASEPESRDLTQFWYIWKLIEQKYPFIKDTPTDTEKMYGAISGLVNSYGDPYTVFFPPQEAKLFDDQVKGSFGGVGMEVGSKDGYITVIAPLKGSRAEQAGILAGDIVTEIDGTSTDGMNINTAISHIRGDVGTPVTLGIARKGAGEILRITITRDIVSLPILETSTKGDVFIISLYSFSENSAKLFKEALQGFRDSGKKKLIIDLRNNPGGYLDAAVDIASYFLPEGKTIVRENSGSQNPEMVHQSKGFTLLQKNPSVIVLINEGSASASEILAGALEEQGVARLVGTTSFGKGSVQQLIHLSDTSAVKITVAKWLTPKGVSISEKGIIPTVTVDEKPVKDEKTGEFSDPQLAKALNLLK